MGGYFDRDQLVWTIRTIRFLEILGLGLILACCYLMIDSHNPYYTGVLVFSMTATIIAIFLIASVEKGLHLQKHYVWNWARGLSIIALATPALPLAALSLRELFDKSVKEDFMGSRTVYSSSPIPWVSKLAVAVVALLCVVGGSMYFQFSKNSTFFDVAFQKPAFNIAPNQSIGDLYAQGAECNTEGRTQCSIAAFLQILKKRPGDNRALLNLAMAQAHSGEHEFAVYNFKNAFQRGAYRSYDALFHYGRALAGADDPKGAIATFQTVLKMQPELTEAAAKIVLVHIDELEYKKALDFIESFVQKNPKAEKRFATVRKRLRHRLSL